jgi:hypothetical protein
VSEYTRQLTTVIEHIRKLANDEPLSMDDRLSIQTLEHFIRRPDLARGSAEFAIRRAVPSWWVNTALWWDNDERSIFGSYVERETVRSIRGEVIRRVYGAHGYEIEQLQPPGEFCYACRQWQSKAAFNWHMGRGGECRRESYCRECQQGGARVTGRRAA